MSNQLTQIQKLSQLLSVIEHQCDTIVSKRIDDEQARMMKLYLLRHNTDLKIQHISQLCGYGRTTHLSITMERAKRHIKDNGLFCRECGRVQNLINKLR